MRLLLLTLSFPVFLTAQGNQVVQHIAFNTVSDTISDTVSDTISNLKTVKKDTLNVVDAAGKKQGHWIILGGEVPNSGIGSSDILEQGDYLNDERTGIWTRYGSKGEVKAVMRYSFDDKTKAAVRDQFYHFAYYSNGKIQRKPLIGECASASDYYVYSENGELKEAEIFDKDCNTSIKLQQITKGELDSIDLFKPVYFFKQISENNNQSITALKNFEQSGDYCVDYLHRLFQIGTFANGVLVEGKEIEVDEMMRPQKVWYISGGKIVKVTAK